MNDSETLLMPFEERVKSLLSRVFGGMHHVDSFKRESPKRFSCLHYGTLSTFDFNTLTSLVLGAHEYAVRVEMAAGGPRRLKIHITERGKRDGDYSYERHPSIEEAIKTWESK